MTSPHRPLTALALPPDLVGELFTPAQFERLEQVSRLVSREPIDLATADDAQLADLEAIITGWRTPFLSPELLDRMPRLRLVAHAAGTVRFLVGEEAWRRGITVTTAAGANAWPVAQYTLAMILLSAKDVIGVARRYRDLRTRGPQINAPDLRHVGNNGPTVGIIAASTIGRMVLDLLRRHDHQVLVHDPFLTSDQARELGAELVGLDELFARSDVVSLHAPDLPSTRHMITGDLLALLRDGATFINTARPSIVDDQALRAELRTGRIQAVLDVTDPEPLPADDELFDLPNVLLTPHWAGSLGNELGRLADLAIDAVDDLTAGRASSHAITLERWRTMA